MSDLSMHLHDVHAKSAEQAKLDADKAAFFARGGTIRMVPIDEYDADAHQLASVVTYQTNIAKGRKARRDSE